jgi:hypothetical protein
MALGRPKHVVEEIKLQIVDTKQDLFVNWSCIINRKTNWLLVATSQKTDRCGIDV